MIDLVNMEKKLYGYGLKIKELELDILRGNEMFGSKIFRGY